MRQRVTKMHITFVCTGNTCRSPMAQGIFEKLIKDREIKNVTCSSCGLFAFPGDSATPEAVEAVKKMGVDISDHRSRGFSAYIIDETDWFICMTRGHKATLEASGCKKKITVLGDGVPDPYGGDVATYEKCASYIKESLEIIADLIIMKIVPFDKDSVKGIADIEKECFSAPWSEESIKAELSNENAHFLVAKAGERVLGYIGVHEIVGEGYIANVAVSKKYRRCNIATALMDMAEKGAKQRNCDFISLEVRKSNIPAIALYEKRGYTVRGERKNFYSDPVEDGLIMTLDLR